MTTKTVDSEANGASLSLLDNMPESAIYEYDINNRLKKVTTADTIAAYSYLPDGRRASKTVNGVKTSHIWDGNNIVADTKNGILTKYIRSNKLEQAVTGDNIQNYTVDSRGDVIDFGDTDYFYDAFGNVQTQTDPNPFGYCGEYFDQETGFIYLRNRYYDPTIGRFTQEDPIRDGSNWYAYCANNPTSFVDPLGLDAIIITNNEAASKQGHTSAIYQAANGDWFYTYWGNKAVAVIHIPDTYVKEWRRNGDVKANSMNSLSDFNNALNRILAIHGFQDITSDYTDATYIVGDFSDSLSAAYDDVNEAHTNGNGILKTLNDGSKVFQGRNSSYNLLWNNCLDRTYASLSKGTLSNDTNAGTYMKDLGFKGGLKPNNATSKFAEIFMNSSFTYSGAYSALKNYATLYAQGSPWAQKWEKANYANSVIGR